MALHQDLMSCVNGYRKFLDNLSDPNITAKVTAFENRLIAIDNKINGNSYVNSNKASIISAYKTCVLRLYVI